MTLTVTRRTPRRVVASVAKALIVRRPLRWMVRRGLVPYGLVEWFPFSAELEIAVAGGAFVYVAASDDPVARRLYWRGLKGWEPETWNAFLPLVARARGFVDVGSFTGVFTLVACASNPTVACVALEPVPRVFARLERNVAANRWTDRVTLVNAAASTTTGTSRFFVPIGPSPDTGHLEASARTPVAAGEWVDVATTTLTAALPPGFPVDLLKVDVEDAEGPVLRGMSDIIAEYRPHIIIEVLASGSYPEAAAVLDAVGYDYFHLTSRGQVRMPTFAPRLGDPNMNYLCVPKP
jgi:FkbM family methyltransferase